MTLSMIEQDSSTYNSPRIGDLEKYRINVVFVRTSVLVLMHFYTDLSKKNEKR